MNYVFIPDIPIYVCSSDFEGYLLCIKQDESKQFSYLNKTTNEKETSQEDKEGGSSNDGNSKE